MAMKKTAKKSGKAKAKRDVGGRPTKYLAFYAEQARKLALLGMTNERMADFFGVALSTLHLWRDAHPEFSDAIKAGKDDADAKVATSLYHSALGGGTVTQVQEEEDAEGNVITKKTVKELPANVTAQIFWLKNRQPQQWRDKVVLEDETPPEVLAETAVRFEEIMAKARERQRRILIERGILPGDGA
ncbi:MAG: hypothetical protein L0H23_00655 [Luteimonas sp.]|nr:hypothetical protein [Luteimonas sp.]